MTKLDKCWYVWFTCYSWLFSTEPIHSLFLICWVKLRLKKQPHNGQVGIFQILWEEDFIETWCFNRDKQVLLVSTKISVVHCPYTNFHTHLNVICKYRTPYSTDCHSIYTTTPICNIENHICKQKITLLLIFPRQFYILDL